VVNDSRASTLPRWATAHPSGVLLAVQLLAVVAFPFLDGTQAGRTVLGVVSMVVVGMALWAVRHTPALNVVASVLGIPALVFAVLEGIAPHTDWVLLTSAALAAPFYFYVSYGLVRYLFDDDRVSHDDFYGVGAAFTVVAWGFTYLFVAVQVLWPGSFDGTDPGPYGFFALLFLSFTNLTSVGLSDIVPVLDHARSVVILEQVAGVMYVGLVVARLVGLTIARTRDSADSSD
jgi:hypothetical protein